MRARVRDCISAEGDRITAETTAVGDVLLLRSAADHVPNQRTKMSKIDKLRRIAQFISAQDDPIVCLAKTVHSRMYIANIFVHSHALIRGHRNIVVNGELKVGIRAPGFMSPSDKTAIKVYGRLQIEGSVSIGRGSRIEIGDGAVCALDGCNLNGASDFIIRYGLTIGAGSTISWGCQFLDSDWHDISYAGKKESDPAIVIGKHVLIGSRVLINKGVHIGDGCVVGSGSVVTRSFPPGVLIAGNPAQIVRDSVEWS